MDEEAQSVVTETSHPAYRTDEDVAEVRRSDDGYASDATRVGEVEDVKEREDETLAQARDREWEEQTRRRLDRLDDGRGHTTIGRAL